MQSKLFLAAAFVILTIAAAGQDTIQLRRTPYKLKVAVDKKTFYEENINATAYVLPDKSIQLYPGETVFIEIDQQNGVITKLTAVEKILKPEKTLTISFTQSVKNKAHESVMLKIQNPFPFNLVYRAKIFQLGQRRWIDTNVYPVYSKISAFETWADIIVSIALSDLHFQTN